MLKIKDNIDLKELEKFEFKPYYYRPQHNYYVFPNSSEIAIYIFEETKEIMVDRFYDRHLVKLYDLIQAGLVEKVEEER